MSRGRDENRPEEGGARYPGRFGRPAGRMIPGAGGTPLPGAAPSAGGPRRGGAPPPSAPSSGRELDDRERPVRKDAEIAPLDEVLGRLLARTGFGGGLLLATGRIAEAWRASVGEQVAARTEIVSFEEGVLLVRVRDAAWRFDLGFRRDEICRILRREAPEIGLRELRLC